MTECKRLSIISGQKATGGLDLLRIITSSENIRLAYRHIKSNTGSKTAGIDGKTISEFKLLNETGFISRIRKTLKHDSPQTCSKS